MAFSTIQGSGGAPDSFVGTSGVDAITIVNSLGNFFLGAQEADDVATFVATPLEAGVVSNATLKGGQGNDNFSANAFSGINVFNAVFVNGNSDADTLAFNSGLLSATTVQGGQGTDTITVGGNGATSSLINGNKDNDTLTINSAITSSSAFGGQGNDSININNVATASFIGGDDNNDLITLAAGITLVSSTVSGGAGNDTVNSAATTGAFFAEGGDGNDQLNGASNTDTLAGGAGNDTITGGAEADLLSGGAGSDQFGSANSFGAAGTSIAATATTGVAVGNTYTFANGVDVVTDFSVGADKFDVATANVAPIALIAGVLVPTTTYVAYGTFNASTNVFTIGVGFGGGNTDALVVVGGGGQTGVNATGFQVVTGLSAALTATDFV